MAKLPEIATLWIGERLSWLEQLCLKSFADAGHHTTIYSYTPIENIPEGVHAADAEDIYPSEPMLRHARTGSPAIHADMWRLHLLKKTDKIWVDADMYCYRPFNFRRKTVFGWEKEGLICNAVLGLPKTSKALNGLLEFFQDEYAIAPWLKPWQQRTLQAARDEGQPVHMTEQDWGFTGPASVTWFLKKSGEIKYAEPQSAFYPISFKFRNTMINPKINIEDELGPDTMGVHFWARRMKPRLEEKEGNAPAPGSFLHSLVEKHGIVPKAAPIPRRVRPEPAPIPDPTPQVTPTELLLSRLEAKALTCVIDIGADARSEAPYHALLQQRGCKVLGFEPLPEPLEALRAESSDLERYYPFALGDGSSETLNIYNAKELTSAFKPYQGAFTYLNRSQQKLGIEREVTVQTKRLDDLDIIDGVDILKLDVQGSELKILKGGTRILDTAMIVMPRVRIYPIYQDEPMFSDIDMELRGLGFQLHKMLFSRGTVLPNSQINRLKRIRHRTQLTEADAIYIRDPAGCDNWSDEQLKQLTLGAASVFESHDLALFCLDKLVARGVVPADLPKAYVDCLPADLRKS